jgi:hypothetical protein
MIMLNVIIFIYKYFLIKTRDYVFSIKIQFEKTLIKKVYILKLEFFYCDNFENNLSKQFNNKFINYKLSNES